MKNKLLLFYDTLKYFQNKFNFINEKKNILSAFISQKQIFGY